MQRGIHSRNKKAMELVAKGWSALQEVDRVIDYTELNDPRLIPLLRVCKPASKVPIFIDYQCIDWKIFVRKRIVDI